MLLTNLIIICFLLIVIIYLSSLNRKARKIMSSQAELAVQVNKLTAQVVKVGRETRSLINRIDELLTQIGAPNDVAPELQDAVNSLQNQADIVDALVPDVPDVPAT